MKKNIAIILLIALSSFLWIRLHQVKNTVTYVLPASAKVIDWPEELFPTLTQEGEVSAPMTFKMKGDTLSIGFKH
jgi:hypothetical protein